MILRYDGVTSRWVPVATTRGTVADVTKALFFSPGANSSIAWGQHNTVAVGANAALNMEFQVPTDFNSLVSISAIIIPGATNAAADIDLSSTYAALGEAYTNHAETNVAITYNLTINLITALDISSVFTSMATGDFCGINLKQNSIGATSHYLGLLLTYL